MRKRACLSQVKYSVCVAPIFYHISTHRVIQTFYWDFSRFAHIKQSAEHETQFAFGWLFQNFSVFYRFWIEEKRKEAVKTAPVVLADQKDVFHEKALWMWSCVF